MKSNPFLIALSLVWSWQSFAAPIALEIGPNNKDQLPRGKEADGIVGDFLLRNDKVEAVISGDLPRRKANMSTYWDAVAPGCLFDLTLRGQNNDQITIFSPSGQQGAVSYVRVAGEGGDGTAMVETVSSAANHGGIHTRHAYHLRDGWQGVLIVTTVRNESDRDQTVTPNDRWTTFASTGNARGVTWADAVDPADRAGYAFGWVERDGLAKPPAKIELKPGMEQSYARFLAVGRSPAEAVGHLMAWLGETGTVQLRVTDETGAPLSTAALMIPFEGAKSIPAYPDDQGNVALTLPPGNYALEAREIGRSGKALTVTVAAGATARHELKLDAAATLDFDIQDEAGRGIPCKAQILGVDGTTSPNLGPNNRAHGCLDQFHSETGRFRVQVPPGRYRVVVTRGMEFSHLEQSVDLSPGTKVKVSGTLRRLVDTRGWVSADFHNHSTPSGDNTCGTDDRVINLAAEHIEFAPTTEHNRFYDWTPHIEKLGLTGEIATVPGIELTGSGAHFNSFPFQPDPSAQDGGAPAWHKDPRITAVTLREFQGHHPGRWLQINHPDLVENFIDRNGDGLADGGYIALGALVDGLETLNGSTAQILAGAPFTITKTAAGQENVRYLSEFIWLQLLNRGHRLWCVAVSDAHTVHGNGVGGWRMFLPSSTDDPRDIDWREMSENAKAGRIMVTTGPFLRVATEDGIGPGGSTRANGRVKLHVQVQCTDWIEIDRVQVLVNGRAVSSLNFTRANQGEGFQEGVTRFDRVIEVPLSQDSHLIVVAIGESQDLKTGFGSSSQASWRPCAYHNPIFVDVDGGGFTPNGDTLGWDLPVKGLQVDQIKAMLEKAPAAAN